MIEIKNARLNVSSIIICDGPNLNNGHSLDNIDFGVGTHVVMKGTTQTSFFYELNGFLYSFVYNNYECTFFEDEPENAKINITDAPIEVPPQPRIITVKEFFGQEVQGITFK